MTTPSDMQPDSAAPPVDLARHLGWMRNLARALVRDEALAEDLVQDAAVAALEPSAARPLDVRKWLGTVLRNRARDAGRRRAARTAREADAARPEAGPALDELGDRAAMGAELSRRVLSLEEPMRSTLLMRYWDDLPPRAIAKRQGVPVATVKSRLARGLERLRRDLDESRGGDRRAWVLAVLPLSRKTPWIAAPAAAGWTAMNTKPIAAAAAAIIAGGALMLARGMNQTPPDLDPVRPEAEAPERRGSFAGAAGAGVATPTARGAERVAATAPESSAGDETVDAVTYEVTATVLDGSARPMGGVELRLEGTETVGRTAADGRATILTTEPGGTLVAAEDSLWVTVRPGIWREGRDAVPLVVVAPALRIEGRVVNSFGHAVSGASVDVHLPDDFLSRFDGSFGSSTRSGWTLIADDEGRFSFDGAPGVEGAVISASSEGLRGASIDCPQVDSSGLEIVLARPPVAEAARLRGRVLRADGSAATRARVGLGHELVATDAEGLFEIDLDRVGDGDGALVAIEAGALAGEFARPGDVDEGPRRGWPEFVEVTLGGAPLSIEGVVVDGEGAPLAGARVWLDDPSDFGTLGLFPVRREALAAGLQPSRDAVRSIASIGAAGDGLEHGTATAVGEPNATFAWTTTDAEGRFRMEGLDDRSYVIDVAGPNLEYGVRSEPIRAGERSARIVVQTGERFEELRGRVVTASGDGVAGAFITPWVSAVRETVPVLDGSSTITRYFYAPGVRTEDDGSFVMRDVPRSWLQFYVAGQGVVPGYASVDDVEDPMDFEIQVDVRVEVTLEIVDGSLGVDAVRALDASGAAVPMYRIFADGYSTLESVEVSGGRTGVFAVTTAAASLVLEAGGVEVETLAIRPRPGELLSLTH